MRIVKLININVEPLLDVKEIIDKQNENVEPNRSIYKQNKHKTYNSVYSYSSGSTKSSLLLNGADLP